MSRDNGGPEGYIERVRRDTQSYIEDLLNENERLRKETETAQTQIRRQRAESLDYRRQLSELHDRVRTAEEEAERLSSRVQAAEAESQTFSTRYIEVQQQNNNLANLYVASYRLHETIDHGELITVLQEIVINLIGSEQFVILEREALDAQMTPVAWFGVSPERIQRLDLASPPLADAAARGELYVAEEADQDDLIACVPLRAGSDVYGLIGIFGLLPHKQGFDESDHELFELISSHAGTSLFVSRMHEAVPA